MNARRFLDTNILAYTYDTSDPDRQRVAISIVEAEAQAGTLTVSIQVLQEFFAVVTRKFKTPVPARTARAAIDRFMGFHVVEPTKAMLSAALDLNARQSISIWDALILVAAKSAGCSVLLTEDLGHGTSVAGVRIENPFR
ncbi:MAG: PIN domain-containing protein [Planctomycetes bacterium]|nr:PIN domain-containing protein [Planctomycetota bacterium]